MTVALAVVGAVALLLDSAGMRWVELVFSGVRGKVRTNR